MNSRIVESFHVEYYESNVWMHTFWRGHRIEKFSTDLMIFQEIIYDVKPDLIIECGTRFGGASVFLGDMCQLIHHGHVVSIDIHADSTPMHPYVSYLKGDSADPNMASLIAPKGAVLIILDSDHRYKHVLKELDLWSQYVSPGSYLIVEDSNLNGHPIDKHGEPGPWEALEKWLPLHPGFEQDRTREKFGLTANPGGYLRRKLMEEMHP